jgi:Flp pilus assembly protein TadG
MKLIPFAHFLKDAGGNFGIMTAILLPSLLGAAGVAIDLTNVLQVKTQMQGIVDSASLAAVSAMASQGMTPADAEKLAKDFLTGQLLNYVKTGNESPAELEALEKAVKEAAAVSVSQAATSSGKAYEVTLTSSYDIALTPMTRLVAGPTVRVTVGGSAKSTSESETAVSMYLALDRSGSMSFVTNQKNPVLSACANYNANSWPNPYSYSPCYIRKIQALQTAATALFTSLDKSDPEKNLVRVGAVAYTDDTFQETGMSWGTTAASTYVKLFPPVPTGGTDASGAMNIAFDALKAKNTTEAEAHESKDHTNFQRYILLMTDGEMTGASSNWNNGLDQKTRNICKKAKDDGIIILSVAFMAPVKGKEMLGYCASGPDNYYEPDDMNELVAAFGEIAEKAAKTTTRLTN